VIIDSTQENSLWFITKDGGVKISEHTPLGAVIVKHKKLFVQLTNQVVEITEIQLPGKRKMLAKDLLNGYVFSSDAKMIVNPHGY